MTRDWLSVALACAFGAFIGTLTALEISARFEYGSYLWSIGALVGGIAAYVAIDFWHFCAGVAHSYRRTTAWRPDPLWWKAFATVVGGLTMISCSLLSLASATFAYVSDDLTITIGTLCLMFAGGVLYSGVYWLITVSARPRSDAGREQQLRHDVEQGWNLILYGNPIGAAYAVFFGLKWVAVRMPSAIARAIPATINGVHHMWSTIAQFVVGVFVYVHSKRRTICFIDAAIGTAIGYSFGSAIIGAIAGALFGGVNYEIVSVRLLRLAPLSR